MQTLALRILTCVTLLSTGAMGGYLFGRDSSQGDMAQDHQPSDPTQSLPQTDTHAMRVKERTSTTSEAPQTSDNTPGGSLLDSELELLQKIRSLDRDALIVLMNNSPIAGKTISWAMTRLSELDPQAAFDLVMGNRKYERWLSEVFVTLSRSDLDSAVGMVDQLPTRLRKTATQALLMGVPATDLVDFLALQKLLGYVDRSDSILAGWADRMMETDPERGWNQLLARGIENKFDRSNFSIYTYVWFLHDPKTALDAITSMDNPARNDAIALLKSSLGSTAPELVIKWLSNQDRALQDELMPHLLGQYADADPHAALGLAANLSGELRSTAERNIVRNWVGSDPRAAIDWVLEDRQQPDMSDRFKEAVRLFAFHEPEGVVAWATSISEPDLREAALVSIATTGEGPYVRPETSLAAAAVMEDPVNRTRLARAAYLMLQKQDESASRKVAGEHFSGKELAEITARVDSK